ncbi:MAG: tRNA lysidine(34) synthetase TilS [Phyllobacterium sp.]
MNAPASSAEISAGIDPEQLFSDIRFPCDSPIIAAVSGGSDSVALLLLLKAFMDKMPAGIGAGRRVIAITVDHGLRDESAEEARNVTALCDEIGVEHRIVKWEGDKPATGISVAAREARYSLLLKAAEDMGARLILTGHTLDDQVETHVMRASRGAGRGLAAMAPATLLGGGDRWLVRPLLSVRRQALRQYLTARAIGWSDDPTNEKDQYERVRIRKGMTVSRFAEARDAIDESVRQRLLTNAEAANFLIRNVSFPQPGLAVLPAEPRSGAKDEVLALGMGVLLAVMGGRSFLPSVADCQSVLTFLDEGQAFGRISRERCIIQKTRRQIRIYREMRDLPEIDLPPGQSAIWDGRYHVRNDSDQSFRVTAEGKGMQRGVDRDAEFYRLAALSQPAIRHVETIGDRSSRDSPTHTDVADIFLQPYFAPFDRFLPGYDVILANATARLFGRPPYPEPPLMVSVNQNCKK